VAHLFRGWFVKRTGGRTRKTTLSRDGDWRALTGIFERVEEAFPNSGEGKRGLGPGGGNLERIYRKSRCFSTSKREGGSGRESIFVGKSTIEISKEKGSDSREGFIT